MPYAVITCQSGDGNATVKARYTLENFGLLDCGCVFFFFFSSKAWSLVAVVITHRILKTHRNESRSKSDGLRQLFAII